MLLLTLKGLRQFLLWLMPPGYGGEGGVGCGDQGVFVGEVGDGGSAPPTNENTAATGKHTALEPVFSLYSGETVNFSANEEVDLLKPLSARSV